MSDQSADQGELKGWESRAIAAAQSCLESHKAKKKLVTRVFGLLRSFYTMFNDMQQKLPPGQTELEFHEDRICFNVGGIPLTVIYLRDEKPMFVEINKRPVLTERLYITNRNFGSGGDTSESPLDYEVGSVFVADEVYLVRWDGKIDVWNSDIELIDSILSNYYSLQDKHKDRDGNEIVLSTDAWLLGQNKMAELTDDAAGEIHIPIPGANLGMYNIPKAR